MAVQHRPRVTAPSMIAMIFGMWVLLYATAGCRSPALVLADRASVLGMRTELVPGTFFQHVVFYHASRPTRTLHVYLDGDGTPWFAGRPSEDPTPRNHLVLDLMALDPNSSVYLGRPCYHGLAKAPPCSSALWTTERYSETVVSSIAAALRSILAGGEFDQVIWFGYSGGGTLAVLLAPQFVETRGVVTVAANLDIDAWADHHNYPRLAGSLNPRSRPPMPRGVYQRHYVGEKDRIVPKEIVSRTRSDPSTVIVVPAYNHRCCWPEIWPAIVQEAEDATRSHD
jgi:hypothetical protein